MSASRRTLLFLIKRSRNPARTLATAAKATAGRTPVALSHTRVDNSGVVTRAPEPMAVEPESSAVQALNAVRRSEANRLARVRQAKDDDRRRSWEEFRGNLGFGTAAVGFLYFFWKCLQAHDRETPIFAPLVDTSNPYNCEYRDSDDFERVSEKRKGILSGAILKDKKTGKLYMKKAAKNKYSLLVEYAAANVLHALDPELQPECLLLQEKREDGTAQFYTLVELVPNSCDLEDFLLQGDWREKLRRKPMTNLAGAIALDCLFGKQSDIKAANLLVVELQDRYVVINIDNERFGGEELTSQLGETVADFSQESMNKLFMAINDAKPAGEYNESGLAGHEVIQEFREYVMTNGLMKAEDVRAAYHRVARLPQARIEHIIYHTVVEEAGSESIFSKDDARIITEKMFAMQAALVDAYPEFQPSHEESVLLHQQWLAEQQQEQSDSASVNEPGLDELVSGIADALRKRFGL